MSEHTKPFYRMRSRVVTNAPHRTFYIQRRYVLEDGRETWVTVARSFSRSDAVAFTALSEHGLIDEQGAIHGEVVFVADGSSQATPKDESER